MKIKKSILRKIIKEVIRKSLIKDSKSINEYIDLSTPVDNVRNHLDKFSKALDQKAGGSFDGDAGEYHDFEGGDNTLYAKRHKKLSNWETKVNAALIRLLKDYEGAWKK